MKVWLFHTTDNLINRYRYANLFLALCNETIILYICEFETVLNDMSGQVLNVESMQPAFFLMNWILLILIDFINWFLLSMLKTLALLKVLWRLIIFSII